VLDVERWAVLRREHFVRGVSIKELARRFGVDRNTVRRALRSDAAPVSGGNPQVARHGKLEAAGYAPAANRRDRHELRAPRHRSGFDAKTITKA